MGRQFSATETGTFANAFLLVQTRKTAEFALKKKKRNIFAFFALYKQINVKGTQQLPCSVVRAAEPVKMAQLQK